MPKSQLFFMSNHYTAGMPAFQLPEARDASLETALAEAPQLQIISNTQASVNDAQEWKNGMLAF